MSVTEKYSKEEWKTIQSLPQAIGLVMGGAKFSGLIGSTKEIYASVKAIMDAKNKYQDNLVIQAIVPPNDDTPNAISNSKEQRRYLMDKIKSNDIKSSVQLKELVMNDCSKSISLLKSKETAKTVQEYKGWILDIAMDVANAAKEGDFLGFGGERFSEDEQKFYGELKELLRL